MFHLRYDYIFYEYEENAKEVVSLRRARRECPLRDRRQLLWISITGFRSFNNVMCVHLNFFVILSSYLILDTPVIVIFAIDSQNIY